MLRLAGAGSRCHIKSITLRQQQQQLADILVQAPPNNYAACCRVGGSRGGGGWWLCRLYTFWCSIFYFLASAASSPTCDMCLRFRGCPVVRDIELSVSVRYQKTRVLLRARRLLLLLVAASRGCVRQKIEKKTSRETEAKHKNWGQS